jgi:hypothetical protein
MGGKRTLAADQFSASKSVVGTKVVEARVPFSKAVERLERVLDAARSHHRPMQKECCFG